MYIYNSSKTEIILTEEYMEIRKALKLIWKSSQINANQRTEVWDLETKFLMVQTSISELRIIEVVIAEFLNNS